MDEWTSTSWEASQLRTAPDQDRGRALLVSGRARAVETVLVPRERAQQLEFDRYYRVRVDGAAGDNPLVLFTRTIPQSWQASAVLDEPITAQGVFLKLGDSSRAPPPLLLACSRIAWFPDTIRPELGVAADQVFLARWGMDIGLFDEVRARNRSGVSAEERGCFYALLAALSRASPAELRGDADPDLPLATLLQSPQSQHGRMMLVRGSVRRIQRVLVGDREIQQRLGADAYYQMDIFVPLDSQAIRLGERPDGPIFENSFRKAAIWGARSWFPPASSSYGLIAPVMCRRSTSGSCSSARCCSGYSR
jgi:hypothetical protein